MLKTRLPEGIQGQWIWGSESPDSVEQYVFLRREFALNETPSTAELWITSSTIYHFFINGRHLCYGPSPAVGHRYYMSYFDIGFCLEVGTNVLCALAYNTYISRGTHSRKRSGFFCQLHVDSTPYLWSDESWYVMDGDCYQPNQPRVSGSTGFIECVDQRKYPHNWTELHYELSAEWAPVTNVIPHSPQAEVFLPSINVEPISEKIPFDNLIFTGAAVQDKVTTHVYIPGAMKNAQGLYVAETFVQEPEDVADLNFYLFSDDPYSLFVNNKLVKSQGVERHLDWTDPDWNAPRCYKQSVDGTVDGKMSLNAGWNRIVLYQVVGPNSCGATFTFPDLHEGELKFVKNMSSFGLPGWNVAGPLDFPLYAASGSINLSGMPQSTYYAIHPCDEAAHLLSYSYEAGEQFEEPLDFVELKTGQYALIEIESYQRGCVEMSIAGSSGDTVDFVYGEHLQGNVLSPYDQGVRRIFPLILDDGEHRWQAVAPQGMNYLMIVVRHASDRVIFQDIGIRVSLTTLKDQNSFSCSDELMNQIWDSGVATMNATYDHVFLNAGGAVHGQILGSAMIQGITSFFIYGHGKHSEKALREFAEAQYDTGEIPGIAPGDIQVRYYDYSMLWPIWLQQHVLNTGNVQLAHTLLPNLDRLLSFLDGLTANEFNVIGNLEPPYAVPCLIDFDQTIERRGISTGLNALYCLSLLKCEWLYAVTGNEEKSVECNRKAAGIAEQIRQLTWNEEKGLFADCWYGGHQSANLSLQSNVLALYAGIAEPDNYERIFNTMFFDYAPYQEMITDKQNENPYFKFFLLDMAFNLNLRDWAIEYMRYYWGKMIQQGAYTWWDKFCPDVDFTADQARSVCEGYGVVPNYFFIKEIAGIRVADPEGSKVFFNPVLSTCEWVRAKIQTPQGGVKVEWSHLEGGELEIRIDADFQLQVFPQLDPTIAENAVLHISDNVTIIEPEV